VNIMAIPLLFIIIALAVSALIFQSFFPFFGLIFAESTDFFIAMLLSSLRFFSNLPFAYFEVPSINVFAVICYYIFLIIICEISLTSIDKYR
ncbi:MAG: ComEC/Rec2 family competence protein, partial [Candidatus Omnitrophota bacterium]|nr:ComEC/Rec2 family competence protein [Candidatus Omnitrophota bacterium]